MKRHDYYVITCKSGSKRRILLHLPESTPAEAQKEAAKFFKEQGDAHACGSHPILLIGHPVPANEHDIPESEEPTPYRGVGTVWFLPNLKE